MPAARRPCTAGRRTTSAASTASTASTSSRSSSARARAPLPAVTPRLTGEARDDRAPHEPAAAVAAEQVDAHGRLADRHFDARRGSRQLARPAQLVVAARIWALADPELPRRDLRLCAPHERRVAVAAHIHVPG